MPTSPSRNGQKAPLYRRVNTTAHGVHHLSGGDYRDGRNPREPAGGDGLPPPPPRISMHAGKRRGLDYTPLFRFLLSRVGAPWNEVHSEAVARLDQQAPIFWMVALRKEDWQEYVRLGESTYFSGLCVDARGLLQRVNPGLGPDSLVPQCHCCTHTFNGMPFTRRFEVS
jgi:hypothetical protein